MTSTSLGCDLGRGPPSDRASLEAVHGPVWDTEQLGREFVLIGLTGRTLTVVRKADGVEGVLTVQTGPPQFYFRFQPAASRLP